MKLSSHFYFLIFTILSEIPSQVNGGLVDSIQRLRNFRCDQVKQEIDLTSDSVETLTLSTEVVEKSIDLCWNVTTKKGWNVRFHVLLMELEYCFSDCRQCHFLEFHNRKPRAIFPVLELARIHDRQCNFFAEPMPFYFTSSDRMALIRLHLDKMWKNNGSAIKIEMWKVEQTEDERDGENCDPTQPTIIDTNKFPIGTVRNFVRSDGKYRLNETCRWFLQNNDPHKILRFVVHRIYLPGSCPLIESWRNCYQACDEIGTSVGIWNARGEIDYGSLIYKGCGIFSPVKRFASCNPNTSIEFISANQYQRSAIAHFGFIIEYQRKNIHFMIFRH